MIEVDFETRSDVNLKTCGAHVYFESPHTEVLIASYSIDDGPVRRWERGQPCPLDLYTEIVVIEAMITAHNASFEYLCFRWLHKHAGWPMPDDEQFRCTAAEAAAMALPRDLDRLGAVLGLTEQKDKEGKRLIDKFSKPRRTKKDEMPGIYFNEPEDHPEDWAKFKAYCDQDVKTEAAADKRMVSLSAYEQRVYALTERINRRGVRIDVRSARSAIRLAEKTKKILDQQMKQVTGGAVTACTQVEKLTTWVQEQNVALDSLGKADIVELLDKSDVPENIRIALELRQDAGKTSVSKLKTMLKRANKDDRVRGTGVYHAASTGRTQSVGVNLSNLPRPRPIFGDAHPRPDVLFQAFRTEEPDLLPMLYGDELGKPLHLISDAIRGFIWAAPGHDLIQADFSGIEGAVIAWLADETWKLEAMRKIIADPSIPDLYRQTAASIMNMSTDVITKKHPLRQSVGKVSELALGFGGGVMAFVSMAKNYGVNLDELYEPVWGAADEERREKAIRRYENQLKRRQSGTTDISREAWLACEIIKHGWRAQNSAIAQSWRDLENAVREAVQRPGTITEAARVKYTVKRGFLWALLPSGRALAYGGPKLKDQVWAKVKLPDGVWSDAEVMDRDSAERGEMHGLVKVEGPTSAKVTVLGVDGTTKQWTRFGLYGGIIAENNTQGFARDILVNGMFKVEAAGYPIIFTVYDEAVAEIPRGFGSLREFETLMCDLPDYAEGLPLTASGWRGKRYRKD